MYAIVLTGGKQYKVERNSIIKVEKLNVNVGDSIDLEVLMISEGGNVLIGADVAKSVVKAEVLAQDKARKINIFKYKAKKNVRKRQGHRQPFTAIKIITLEA